MNLYRKYRPKNFKEIVGQQHIKITLQNEIQDDNTTHAYLFCGPRAVGKTTISRVFSKSLNCTKREKNNPNPCNECEMCVSINNGNNLDVIEIDAASHTGVDNVRENIIEVAKVAPSKAKYRIFIIDEAHMLSISAFNALLKLLEEPPENVVFILCTTEVHKIPSTIISRCQRFDFKKIPFIDIVKKLEAICTKEGVTADKVVLEAIARHSEGHMRDAESLLGQVMSIADENITMEDADMIIPRSDLAEALNLLKLLSKKDVTNSIVLVNKIVEEGIDLKVFLRDLIELSRKIMLISINPTLSEKFSIELGEDFEKEINDLLPSLPTNLIINIIDKMIVVQNEIKESFIVQLPLEIAITELCISKTVKNLQELKTGKIIQTKEAPQTAPLVSANKFSNNSISKSDVNAKWIDFLTKIKKENHSLSFVLQACSPSEIVEGKITLTFRYKFHKNRMDEVEIKQIVEKAMSEIYKTNIFISTAIGESEEPKANLSEGEVLSDKSGGDNENKDEAVKDGGDGMINDLLKTFGGKVVN